ncbi:MAG: hypothetical protein U0798_00600 [Gemmataceae bacterium]
MAAILPAMLWYAGAKLGWWDWPRASGPFGVALGLFGGAIVIFEMLIAPRKWYRGWRLGATRAWMRWHVILGFLCLPVIVIHSGFAFGGWLSSVTMWLFLIVIVSGIYGLVLQQWLPKKLFDEIPNETVAAQISVAVSTHREESRELVADIRNPLLDEFFKDTFDPYLEQGSRSGSLLASPAEADRLFGRLKAALPAASEPAVDRLAAAAALRRQWDRQVRLTWWLHSWLEVHLPFSVAMTGFMIGHAIFAMRWY